MAWPSEPLFSERRKNGWWNQIKYQASQIIIFFSEPSCSFINTSYNHQEYCHSLTTWLFTVSESLNTETTLHIIICNLDLCIILNSLVLLNIFVEWEGGKEGESSISWMLSCNKSLLENAYSGIIRGLMGPCINTDLLQTDMSSPDFSPSQSSWGLTLSFS